MATNITGVPGGAQQATVTTAVAIDLTALARREVKIWSSDADLWFCFAASDASTTLITSGTSAASATSLKADRAAQNLGVIRYVSPKFPWLIVSSAGASATVHVKATSELDPRA
jgi:hypothetical protein